MFLLGALDSMPQMQVSDALMEAFLWVLKESGAPDVPSLGQLHEARTTLLDSSGMPSGQHKSAHGNIFYTNDIRPIVSNVHRPTPLPRLLSAFAYVVPGRLLFQSSHPTADSDLPGSS